jgi:tetratricopeptide (TPR) repeat protein
MEFESGQREPEEWERVIDDCVARFHAATSVQEKSRLLVRVGQVLHAELGDEEQGFDALLEALRLDPSNDEAVGELAPLARRMRRWPQVVDLLRGFLAAEEDPRRRIQLCEHAARWCKEAGAELGPDAADPFVVEIDRIDPSHWAVRRRLASLYREQGLWDLRREELDRALLRATTRDEVRDTRFALGELHEVRLGDRARATLHYEAALACDPQSRHVLAALARVYEARELHDRLRDALTTLVSVTPDPAEKGVRLVQLAEVWERHFLKPARAASLLEEALALVPGDLGALDRLEQCYRAMRAWPEYVRTLERRLEALSTRGERAAVLVQIGQTCESALRDPARAVSAYRRACVLDPRTSGR